MRLGDVLFIFFFISPVGFFLALYLMKTIS